jgi:hypothetical protein
MPAREQEKQAATTAGDLGTPFFPKTAAAAATATQRNATGSSSGSSNGTSSGNSSGNMLSFFQQQNPPHLARGRSKSRVRRPWSVVTRDGAVVPNSVMDWCVEN